MDDQLSSKSKRDGERLETTHHSVNPPRRDDPLPPKRIRSKVSSAPSQRTSPLLCPKDRESETRSKKRLTSYRPAPTQSSRPYRPDLPTKQSTGSHYPTIERRRPGCVSLDGLVRGTSEKSASFVPSRFVGEVGGEKRKRGIERTEPEHLGAFEDMIVD